MLKPTKNVAVLGGGISGLSYAYYLLRLCPEISIQVFEQSLRVGGYVKTGHDNGVIMEKGPRTLRSRSDGLALIVDLMTQAGLKDTVYGVSNSSPANRKYLLNPRDELIEVPNSLTTFFRFFFGNTGLNESLLSGIFREPFKPLKLLPPGSDELVELFFDRRFGRLMLQNLLSAIYHGIYAGDIAKLGMRSIMPQVFEIEQGKRSSIVGNALKSLFTPSSKKHISPILEQYNQDFPNSDVINLKKTIQAYPILCFSNGMDSVAKALYSLLKKQQNVVVHHKSPISEVKSSPDSLEVDVNGDKFRFDHVHSTLAAPTLGSLLEKESLSKSLRECQGASVFLMNIYVPKKNLLKLPGFGYLIPKSYYDANPQFKKEAVLGVIYDSCLDYYRQPVFGSSLETKETCTKLTVMMGGHFWAQRGSTPSIEECVAHARGALTRQLGIDFDTHKPQIEYELVGGFGIPQYTVGYDMWATEVRQAVQAVYDGRLTLGGMNFNRGVGVPDCVSLGYGCARGLARDLSRQG